MKHLVIVVVIALISFVGYTLYRDTQRIPVKIVAVTRGNARLTVSTVFTGSVVSNREATLSFYAGGQLRSLAVQEGGGQLPRGRSSPVSTTSRPRRR
jgi:multidrug efflux pump subunit AcrA (membrane-fusion protein)